MPAEFQKREMEFTLIQSDLVVVELPDHRVDALSMGLTVAAWIFLFLGLRRLAAAALPERQRKLLRIPMAGLGLYTLGCLAIVLEQWRFLFIVPLGLLLTAAGMVIVGVGVIRRKVWPGWQAFTLVLVGLYPFLGMFPVVALYGAPNYSVNYFWGVPWLLLGYSLYAKPAPVRAT